MTSASSSSGDPLSFSSVAPKPVMNAGSPSSVSVVVSVSVASGIDLDVVAELEGLRQLQQGDVVAERELVVPLVLVDGAHGAPLAARG